MFCFSIIIDNLMLAALMVLPALLPDACCKVAKVIYTAEVRKLLGVLVPV